MLDHDLKSIVIQIYKNICTLYHIFNYLQNKHHNHKFLVDFDVIMSGKNSKKKPKFKQALLSDLFKKGTHFFVYICFLNKPLNQ